LGICGGGVFPTVPNVFFPAALNVTYTTLAVTAAAVPAASPHTAARRCHSERHRHTGAGSAPTATWTSARQAVTAARLPRAAAAPAGLGCTISR
jgi:hypothetical protein